jgi:hypothetical protein
MATFRVVNTDGSESEYAVLCIGECIQCEAADARAGSKFCSDACRQAFRTTMPFVLICRHRHRPSGEG